VQLPEIAPILNLVRMKPGKGSWITIALFNLCITAALGVLLRTKMVFPLEAVEFSNILEAHYHFAMNGWITFTIMVLLVYELLPEQIYSRPVYQWMRWAILFISYGMAVCFIIGGYDTISVVFTTFYIIFVFIFAWVFSRDLIRSKPPKPILVLAIAAMISLILSCIGPETFLGYVIASHSMNVLLFRDTAYTYLHFQYNGFFPLAIFALFFNYLYSRNVSLKAQQYMRKVAVVFPLTIIPALFLSYLWHYPNIYVRSVAAIGCISLYVFLFFLYRLLAEAWDTLKEMDRYVKFLAVLSLISLTVKIILQTGTVIPYVGIIVFGNRPIIIGYIHLVMLGFVTLYFMSHLLRINMLESKSVFSRMAILVFASGVVVNEVLLMLQGLSQILMKFYPIYMWLLWCTVIWLLIGAILIFISHRKHQVVKAR
jgi:hypothetical protein